MAKPQKATYKTRILQDAAKWYFGEVWKDNVRIYQGEKQFSRANAIRFLNRNIEKLNANNSGMKIPPYVDTEAEIAMETKMETETAFEPQKELEPKAQAKPKKPPRKPFTPYGLNGYLVDKKGNVRLHLDRKASAQTLVLEPEMFRALAEMVERTQAQNGGKTE